MTNATLTQDSHNTETYQVHLLDNMRTQQLQHEPTSNTKRMQYEYNTTRTLRQYGYTTNTIRIQHKHNTTNTQWTCNTSALRVQ